ncbi:MAG TPA: YdeI/OmpD-associated family protein [Caulobacteraceae bacterium]|nr:YdeI/OmpD-associated family protein [Caulobacteraceae bacterium]
MSEDDLPLLTFTDAASLERWLDEQGAASRGAWLRFARKGAPQPTVSKSDAIDCALAFGWVDGQLGRIDDHYFKTRFTPRRANSAWSQANRERIENLEAAGRMRPPLRAQVDQAKADGRWAAAYARQSQAAPDADLNAALDAHPAARALFDALDAAILYRVQQAKTPQKRAAKIAELVAMLSRGETIHPRKAKRALGKAGVPQLRLHD